MRGGVTLSDVEDMTQRERLLWLRRITKQLRAEAAALKAASKAKPDVHVDQELGKENG
jgi:hypothetical protein